MRRLALSCLVRLLDFLESVKHELTTMTGAFSSDLGMLEPCDIRCLAQV